MGDLSAKTLERLREAAALVAQEHVKGTCPIAVIDMLVERFGAVRGTRATSFTLRCCGVMGTSTWSRDGGLLLSWQRLAGVALQSAKRRAAA